MIVDAHKKEIREFDAKRVLPAWDSIVSQQQLRLQKLQVPTMYATSESATREVCSSNNFIYYAYRKLQLQQRVLQVLISLIGPSIK
jgi:hypothetical protein